MLLRKKQYKLVTKVINSWENQQVISEEESARLKNTIKTFTFDWKRLAVYSFWVAGISFAISVSALLLDDAIMELLKRTDSVLML